MSAGSQREKGRELVDRFKHGLSRAWRLLVESGKGFSLHRCTQLAASMSYYALFSVFPAAIVAAAIAGAVLDDPDAQKEAVNFLFDELPLSDDQGKSDIEEVVKGVTNNAGTLGVIGVVALLISASALISAARNSLNRIHGDDVRRGLLRGKGLDVALILFVGLLFAASFALTFLSQLDLTLTGRIGDTIQAIVDFGGALLPILLAAVVFWILYAILPVHRQPLRDIWPGVVLAAVGYELVKRGFSVYLDNFANYSAIYGSLGAVIAFMFFVYIASLLFLYGGEMSALWPRVRAGEFDPDPEDEGKSFKESVRDFVLRLFQQNEVTRRE